MLDDAPLALAFGAGMLAAFNPCGFAMLPAYLAWFLGVEGDGGGKAGVLRGLAVGSLVTAGFVSVFAVVGFLAERFSAVWDITPYVTFGLGLLLVPLGILLLTGRQLKLRVPTVSRGPRRRTLLGVTLFGVSYATVSLGCTLPLFLGPVATTLSDDLASGVAVFAAYTAGIGLVLISLTVAVALARDSVVRHFRRVLPYVGRASGAVLTLTGAYVAYYGWYEIEVLIRGNTDVRAGPVDWVTERTNDLATWVTETGTVRIGVVLTAFLAAMAGVGWLRRRGGRPGHGVDGAVSPPSPPPPRPRSSRPGSAGPGRSGSAWR